MPILFVLLPADRDLDRLLAELATPVRDALAAARLRRYPRADGAAHLRSIVRDGRDPAATRWRRGMVLAVGIGASLGAIVNCVLAGAFGMFGGLIEIAVPLGFVLGAFLGGFTAAMIGTQVARDELRPLLAEARPGDVLLQWTSADMASLRALAVHLERMGLRCMVVGS